MALDCEVLVIGAGASGISACRELTRAGLDVICVEARDRVGGRILTVIDPLAPLPIELGPEFVHGRPTESWELIRIGRLTVFDCAENAVHMLNGRVHEEADAWEQVDAITEEMKRVVSQGSDPTFLDFLNAAEFTQSAKQLATSYVEGFNAARKEEIGIASLALDAIAADAIDGDRNFRIASGYQAFMDVLLSSFDPKRWRLELGTIVEQVRWSRNLVEASVRAADSGRVWFVKARRVVITLPLGVLQAATGAAGSVTFVPRPERIFEAVHALRFGQVMRLVMRFAEPWWEDMQDLADAGFWLSQEQYFPTWWTSLPVRSNLLTGWSAGPHADELIGKSKNEIVERALSDLAKISGKTVAFLRERLEGFHFHDWHGDPFARGAYSYVPAGAMAAREAYAEPVEETLFFAGEATETNGHGGTVHGAIASGRRAAEQILQCRLRTHQILAESPVI